MYGYTPGCYVTYPCDYPHLPCGCGCLCGCRCDHWHPGVYPCSCLPQTSLHLDFNTECISKHSKRKSLKCSPEKLLVELDDPDDKADTLAASRNIENVKKSPKKLWNASELQRECSEQRVDENSPEGSRDKLREPDEEAVIPDCPHSAQEGSRGPTRQRFVETIALCRDRSPGGHEGKKGKPQRHRDQSEPQK